MGHLLWEMFDWPSGNVAGNLAASGICFVAGFLASRGLRRKAHETHRMLAELHKHHLGGSDG